MHEGIVVAKEFTPTTVYFFAKENNILSADELRKCYIAAKEYLLEPKTDGTPCTRYFRSISSAGCIKKNDKLSAVKPKRSTIMPSGMNTGYYEEQAITYMQRYVVKLEAEDKEKYRQEILDFIKPYLEKRAEKFAQFCQQTIQYIRNASLPEDKAAKSMIDTFKNLENDERALLRDQIINTFYEELQTGQSYTSYFISFFKNTPENLIVERAKQILGEEIFTENILALEALSGCRLL